MISLKLRSDFFFNRIPEAFLRDIFFPAFTFTLEVLS